MEIANFIEPSYIRTFTGKNFEVFDPTEDQIDIIDIAHSLSQLCRWGGHSNRFYSVAQHSIIAARLIEYSDDDPKTKMRDAFCALMHDATEAYLVDLPRPIKKRIQQYKDTENYLYTKIASKFNLPDPMPESVHTVDNDMLYYEWDYFMLNEPKKEDQDFYDTYFVEKSCKEIEIEFLQTFDYYVNKLKEIEEKLLTVK